jgi:hypothetical protein
MCLGVFKQLVVWKASFELYRLIGAVSNYHQSFLVDGGEVVFVPRSAISGMRSSVLTVRNTR